MVSIAFMKKCPGCSTAMSVEDYLCPDCGKCQACCQCSVDTIIEYTLPGD